MKTPRAPLLVAVALAAAGAWLLASRDLANLTGARLEQLPDETQDRGRPIFERRVGGIELPRHGQQHLPWRRVRARFKGYWQVPAAAAYDVRLVANGAAALRVDGREILARPEGAVAPSLRSQVELSAGSHALEADYASQDGPHILRLLVAAPGGAPARVPPEQIFPDPPDESTLARVGRVRLLKAAAATAWLACGAALLLVAGARRVDAALWRLAPFLVVAFAALLRLEAVVALQWQEHAPHALRALAVAAWDFHPPALRHVPGEPGYDGDPFNYLRFAKEMRGFYDAHVREPLFVATARGFIDLVGSDVGLSLASAFYSTLLVAATYLLGATFFTRPVGLLAALALALERHSVAFSALGWRDDAFAFFTVLTLVALQRLRDRPGFGRALAAGCVIAGACLTRITALAYVVPALALSALSARREHGRRADEAFATCAGVFAVAIAPYLLTCWIAFGDPLHSINAHTVFYRGRAGLPSDTPMNVARFLSYGRGPFELLDTMVTGLTSYPFLNKWTDFDDWILGASRVLPAAALLGLAGFACTARGRLLLLALVASLVPYAATWDVPGGGEWRFTLHAYPFYLVAAFWALSAAFRREDRPRLAKALAACLVILPIAWLAESGLRFLRVRELLARGKPAIVEAGFQDAFLLPRGWGRLRGFENGVARAAGPAPAALRLPLADGAYVVALRVRPAEGCPAPCVVELALGGRTLVRQSVEGTGGDDRFGTLEVRLDAALVRRGSNLLELRGGPIELWLARVEPLPR